MSDWYTERRQNRELDELRGEMAQAMSEAYSLRSRLSQLQGGLESRLGRLATAFDAFVELSDIRHDLIGFADAAEVRRYAGQVLSGLASGDNLPAPGRDVPGYWLGPAIEALRGLSTGVDGSATDDSGVNGSGVDGSGGDSSATDDARADGISPLAEAIARDDRRTAIFLCLALAALGRRNQVRKQWLDTAFGTLADDGTVTRVQRALWTAGARGGFGADGLAVVVARLQVPATASAQRWLAPVEARSAVVRQAAPDFAEIADQAEARVRLSRLRAAVETVTGDTAVLEPDRDLAYGATEQPDPDSASALLRMLISEGSEPEREALARVAELRARITDPDGAEAAGGSVDDPAGTVVGLLDADLGRADEPHLSATALRVVAGGVLTGAEELARTASLPSPVKVTCKIDWQQITLLPDGPEQQSMAAAETAIAATVAPLSTRDLAGPLALAGVGLVVAIGLGLLHWFWIIAGAAIVAIGAFRYRTARNRKAAEHAHAAARIALLREKSAQAATELAAYTAESGDRAASVTTDLEGIRKRLAA
jgi:hypothetical protein